jgi:hypothetical protein
MKRAKAVRARRTVAKPFEAGQIWKVGDIHLAVTAVGKTLVHYKRYKNQSKGVPTRLSSKPELEKYLLDSDAILVTG